jgi:hypothetical protein
MVCGTSTSITNFIGYTGGLGKLLVMAQAGFLSHSLTLMAKEIVPRLKQCRPPEAAQNAAA